MDLVIEHQTQLLPDSCVSACLAMALGEPQQKVIDEFHADFMSHEIHSSEYLNVRGITLQPFTFGVEQHLDPEKTWVFFLTVPSLNVVGGLHQVLLVRNKDWDSIYDPAKGFLIEGKQRKYYTRNPECPDALPLTSYVIDFVVDAQEFINYRRNKPQ